MNYGKWQSFINEEIHKLYVHGYVKPENAFHTLSEWALVVKKILQFQKEGHYISHAHGDLVGPPELLSLIDDFYGFQLTVDVERYDLLTSKNVLDHIEDFVNHRYWSLENEFGQYFEDMSELRFAYFYSRGDMEPYVMLDEEFTQQVYGTVYNPKQLNHYTTESGARRLIDSIAAGIEYDISSFTVMERPFFRSESVVLVQFIGNVRAGFRSDIKSMALDNGRRACNMYRLGYPGRGIDNLCYELDSCDAKVETSLWNEYIATPIEIISVNSRL